MRWRGAFRGCDLQQYASQTVATISQWIAMIEGPASKTREGKKLHRSGGPSIIYIHTLIRACRLDYEFKTWRAMHFKLGMINCQWLHRRELDKELEEIADFFIECCAAL